MQAYLLPPKVDRLMVDAEADHKAAKPPKSTPRPCRLAAIRRKHPSRPLSCRQYNQNYTTIHKTIFYFVFDNSDGKQTNFAKLFQMNRHDHAFVRCTSVALVELCNVDRQGAKPVATLWCRCCHAPAIQKDIIINEA
jgi:hypothetical protein